MLLIPLTIALANFVVIKTILSQLDNHPLVFAMLGASVALIHRARQEEASTSLEHPAFNQKGKPVIVT